MEVIGALEGKAPGDSFGSAETSSRTLRFPGAGNVSQLRASAVRNLRLSRITTSFASAYSNRKAESSWNSSPHSQGYRTAIIFQGVTITFIHT